MSENTQTALEVRLVRIENKLDHIIALDEERRAGIQREFTRVNTSLNDHETRLRGMDDVLIALKTHSGWQQAGQAGLTLIAAAIAAWLGASAR